MSDIFEEPQELFTPDTTTPNPGTTETPSFRDITQRKKFWSATEESHAQQVAGREASREQWGFTLPDDQYLALNNAVTNGDITVDEGYKLAASYALAKQYDITPEYARENLDQLLRALHGGGEEFRTGQSAFNFVMNKARAGASIFEKARMGNELVTAELYGDRETAEFLRKRIKETDEENFHNSDPNEKGKNFFVRAMGAAAESAPFTAYVAASGFFGTLLAPGVGTAAAFLASMNVTRGQEYIALRAAGAEPEIANNVSLISGAVQAALEAFLGNALSTAGGSAKAVGKRMLTDNISRVLIEKATANAIKNAHGKGLFLNTAMRVAGMYAGEMLEQGIEEMGQEWTSALALEAANALQEGGVDTYAADEIWENMKEAFKGGMMASIFLGIPGTHLNARASYKSWQQVKTEAEYSDSEAEFIERTKDSEIFEGLDEGKRLEYQKAAYAEAEKRRQGEEARVAAGLKETAGLGEGYAEGKADPETGEEAPLGDLYRRKNGRLYTALDEQNGIFKAGDARVQSSTNLDAHIRYSQDEDGKITIEEFHVRPDRDTPEYRREFFQDFAESFAGHEIQWNPNTEAAVNIREDLIQNNPRGAQAGLDYFAEADAQDMGQARYRNKVIDNFRRYFPNLGNAEHSVMAAEWEHFADMQGLSLEEYVTQEFGSLDAAFTTEPNQNVAAAQAEGKKIKGAVSFESLARDAKAVIYLSKNADLTTFIHEMGHIYRRRLRGDLLAEAERIWGVPSGAWANAKPGKFKEQEERFAEDLERWRRDGSAPTPEMQSFFEKFAEYLKKIINAISQRNEVSPEIKAFFDQLYAGGEKTARTTQKRSEQAETANDTATGGQAVSEAAAMPSEANNKPPAEQSRPENNSQENDRRASVARKKWEAAGRTIGDEDQVTLQTGEEIKGHYELGEAGISTPSVDPDADFTQSGGFPVNDNGTSMNVGRDYTGGFSREAVYRIAAEFDQRGMGIIVDSNGVTSSGNNRDISRRVAARNGTDAKYVGYLKSRPERWGFTQEDVAKYKHPTLYFVVDAPAAYSPLYFDQFNRSGEKSVSPLETAIKMSYLIDADMINEFSMVMGNYESINDLYDDAQAAAGIFRSLMRKGIVTENSYPDYVETLDIKGKRQERVTSSGKDFLESVMLGAVLEEDSIRALALVPEIRKRVVKGLAPMVDNAALGEYSVIPEINQAIAIAVEVQTNKKKYKSIEDYANQSELALGQRVSTDTEVELAGRLLEKTEYGFADMMGGLNAVLQEEGRGQSDMFAGTSKDDILRRYLGVKAQTDDIREANNKIIESDTATTLEKVSAALDNAGIAMGEADGTLFQSAYQGSPYQFVRYDSSHIGEGYGRQINGWGHCFASKKEIADWYRKKLAYKTDNTGQLYKADIPGDEEMLDWDKPLAKQPRQVKNAIEKLLTWETDPSGNSSKLSIAFYEIKLFDNGYGLKDNRLEGRWKTLTEAQNAVKNDLFGYAGSYLYKALAISMESPQAASLHLNSLGIKGIRHLDNTLPGKGIRSHNYVIFDDNEINITDTYFQTEDEKTKSENFKNWFGDWENDPTNASKVVDENGKPLIVYHGTARPDRIGEKFDPKKATSGPMAYFTTGGEIASSYATNKNDTSLAYDDLDPGDYNNWFRVKVGRGKPVPLSRYWHSIPWEQQEKIRKLAPRVTEDDGKIYLAEEGHENGLGNYDYEIKAHKGNVAATLIESWLNSGSLFNDEYRFFEVLKLAGFGDNITYHDPKATYPGVYPVYLNIKNPLDTSEISPEILSALKEASKTARVKRTNDADMWDKNSISPKEWISKLEADIKNDTTFSWTQIPDWVTKTLKGLGFDGIKDKGGKHSGLEHTVWIPFTSNQIKSQFNRGTYSTDDNNILFQLDDELLEDAAQYDSWQDFRDAFEGRSRAVLNGKPVATVSSKDIPIVNGKPATTAQEWIKQNPIGNVETVIGEVTVDPDGINDSFSHTIYANKVFVLPAIKSILHEGAFLSELDDFNPEKDIKYYYFAAPVEIDGERKIVFVRVRQVAEGNKRFYVHDVFTEDEVRAAVPLQEEIDKRKPGRGYAVASPGSKPDRKQSDLYRSIINNVLTVNPNARATDAWYRSLWNDAKKIYPDTLLQEDEETSRPEALDKRWADEARREYLTDALKAMHAILNDKSLEPAEGEDRTEYNRVRRLQGRIRNELPNAGSVTGLAAQVNSGGKLSSNQYDRLRSYIRKNTREYRSVFADIMGQEEYLEELADSSDGEPNARLADPRAVHENTLERLREIGREIGDPELQAAIENGEITFEDPRIAAFEKGQQAEYQKASDAIAALEAEMGEDFARLANTAKQRMVKLYEDLLAAKEKMDGNKDRLSRMAEEGIKIADSYQQQERLNKAGYERAYKAFDDYARAFGIEADVRESIARREARAAERVTQTGIRRRQRALRALKEIKRKLIRRITRSVSFENIAYDQAVIVKTIQRIFEPSIFEGVNKWIGGRDGPLLREVWSQWSTDEQYREQLVEAAGEKRAAKIAAILDKEWDFISTADKKALIKLLPKADFVKDLALEELIIENGESVQLDIDERVVNGKVYYTLGADLERKIKEALGEDLYNRMQNKPLGEWSIVEAEELARVVDQLTVEGRRELRARREARRIIEQRYRDQVLKAINATGITIEDDDTPEEKDRKQKKIDRILGKYASGKKKNHFWNNFFDANLRRFTTAMDGGRKGIFTSLLYWGENDAYNTEQRQIAARRLVIDTAMAKNGITLDELYRTVEIDGLEGTDLYRVSGGKITVDDLLYIMRGYQNEETRKAIMYGNLSNATEREHYRRLEGNADELAEFANISHVRMMSILTFARDFFAKDENKKFLKLAEVIGEDYDRNGERLNKAMIEMFNRPMWRVDNYVPMNRREQSGGENENRVIEDLLGITGVGQKWVQKGFAEKRINISPCHQAPIELGLYKTWAQSVTDTEHLLAYGPLVQTLNAVFKGRGAGAVRQTMQDRWGKASTERIDVTIAEFANPSPTRQKSALDSLIRSFRGKTATAYLAWKVSAVLKQAVTSPWPYLQEIPPPQYLAACFEIAGGFGKANDFIRGKSAYMNGRDFDPMMKLIKEQMAKNENRTGAAVDRFNAFGMKGLEWIDWVAVAPGWLAKYRMELANIAREQEAEYQKLLKKYHGSEYADVLPTEESKVNKALSEIMSDEQMDYEAVARADDAVRRMQPSSRATDLAPMFKNRNEIVNAVLQFQMALNVIWQNIRYDLPLAVKEKQIGTIVGMVAGYAMAGICLGLLLDDDDEEEKKERNTAAWMVYNSLTQFTDAVPVFGSAVTDAAQYLITGKKPFQKGEDLWPVVSKGLGGLGNLATAIREDDPDKRQSRFYKAAGNFAETFGLATGLPVSGAKELGRVLGIGDGDGELGFDPEAFLGRRKK